MSNKSSAMRSKIKMECEAGKKQQLRDLLSDVERLFGNTSRNNSVCPCYDFTLGKFPTGWTFNVVNDWHKWMDAGRKHQFGTYPTPEGAVSAFLDYVRTEHINPTGLTHVL